MEGLNYNLARFLKSAPVLEQLPPDEGAEVAFVGHSNAGKSSALNTITGIQGLARTSKTPGRTQAIQIFDLTSTQRLMDLPGYGFASVPEAVKHQWQTLVKHYLETRTCLKGLILLMDIRHTQKPLDWQMLTWATSASLPVHILLTKADKFNRGPAQNILLKVTTELQQKYPHQAISIQLFSSLKKLGMSEATAQLNRWLIDLSPGSPHSDIHL
jgi:GTP-binding protein